MAPRMTAQEKTRGALEQNMAFPNTWTHCAAPSEDSVDSIYAPAEEDPHKSNAKEEQLKHGLAEECLVNIVQTG